MRNTKNRIVNTELFDKKSFEILRSVIGQLSDGIWENSVLLEKYWLNASIGREYEEVVIKINTETYTVWCDKWKDNPFYHMSDSEIREWFANKIKQIVKFEEKCEGGKKWWKRGNIQELACMGYSEVITVADAYQVYDILKMR